MSTEPLSEGQRKINRTLTQKYDMTALRALQKLEEEVNEKLGKIYGCDGDELPVDIDLLTLYNVPQEERPGVLSEILKDAPSDVSAIITDTLKEIDDLHEGSMKGPSGEELGLVHK